MWSWPRNQIVYTNRRRRRSSRFGGSWRSGRYPSRTLHTGPRCNTVLVHNLQNSKSRAYGIMWQNTRITVQCQVLNSVASFFHCFQIALLRIMIWDISALLNSLRDGRGLVWERTCPLLDPSCRSICFCDCLRDRERERVWETNGPLLDPLLVPSVLFLKLCLNQITWFSGGWRRGLLLLLFLKSFWLANRKSGQLRQWGDRVGDRSSPKLYFLAN